MQVTAAFEGTGYKQVRDMIKNVPINMRKVMIPQVFDELSKSLQRRIKRRAPRGPTGWLRRSVIIDKTGKRGQKGVFVEAFYAQAVEEGRSRKLKIPVDFFKQHKSMPDAPARYVNNPTGWVTLSGRAQPFIQPAVQSFKKDIPRVVERAINKLITRSLKSGGGKSV